MNLKERIKKLKEMIDKTKIGKKLEELDMKLKGSDIDLFNKILDKYYDKYDPEGMYSISELIEEKMRPYEIRELIQELKRYGFFKKYNIDIEL